MARPIKVGLDYFPFDVYFFEDRKIRRLFIKHGSQGILIYLILVCEIYKDCGYYIRCDSDLFFDIGDKLKIDENIVKSMMDYFINIELFSKDLYNQGILSSKGIQKRYKMAKENATSKIGEYNLLDNNVNNHNLTAVNKSLTTVNDGITNIISQINAQSKENENQRKVNNFDMDGFDHLLNIFNLKLKKNLKKDVKSVNQYYNRLKDGYSIENFIQALENAMNDKFHIDNLFNYITIEYITRPEILNKYANYKPKKIIDIPFKPIVFENIEQAENEYSNLILINFTINSTIKNYGGYKEYMKSNGYSARLSINGELYLAKLK